MNCATFHVELDLAVRDAGGCQNSGSATISTKPILRRRMTASATKGERAAEASCSAAFITVGFGYAAGVT
jgi:hypothetical protein